MMSQADANMGDEGATTSAFFTAFEDRVGNHQFQDAAKGWGYLPQVHEWAAKEHKPIEWITTRVGGSAHMPDFEAYPVWCGQHLRMFTQKASSKQKAKEASAKAMAMSGHC